MPGPENALVDDGVVCRGHRDDPRHFSSLSCVTERGVDLGQRRCGGLLDLFAGERAAGAINQVGGRQPTRRFQKVSTAGVLPQRLNPITFPRELVLRTQSNDAAQSVFSSTPPSLIVMPLVQ